MILLSFQKKHYTGKFGVLVWILLAEMLRMVANKCEVVDHLTKPLICFQTDFLSALIVILDTSSSNRSSFSLAMIVSTSIFTIIDLASNEFTRMLKSNCSVSNY